jgi:hypothetical protein
MKIYDGYIINFLCPFWHLGYLNTMVPNRGPSFNLYYCIFVYLYIIMFAATCSLFFEHVVYIVDNSTSKNKNTYNLKYG